MNNLKNIDSETLLRCYLVCVRENLDSYRFVPAIEYRKELIARLRAYDRQCTKHLL